MRGYTTPLAKQTITGYRQRQRKRSKDKKEKESIKPMSSNRGCNRAC
tara:strand:+ start:219 stop:359 length:141 start_codon:yes stop_codon:yes gene_type:complete